MTMERSVRLFTQEDFYTPEDIEFALKDWSLEEVESTFLKFRAAVDDGDHDTMASMIAPSGRAGNATYGLFDDHASYLEFLRSAWNEVIPNRSVWHVIDRGRIVDKWRESLPGLDSDGKRYDYFGINELVYAGNGLFNLQYSIPDVFGLTMVYQKWKSDGHHEVHGEIYPGLG
jgi:hypothetical protein